VEDKKGQEGKEGRRRRRRRTRRRRRRTTTKQQYGRIKDCDVQLYVQVILKLMDLLIN
jgi:hypothetical protein